MMIKRSNRGKLSGSLGGRALLDTREGTQRKWRHTLPYALILVLGLVLSLGMAPATAEAAISGPPAHEKSAKINADGTVDVTLNVTGAVDQSSESSKADVIVVLDLSGSMNLGVNKVSDRNADKSKTYYVVDDNYNVRTVKYRTSIFGGHWYYTDNNTWCWESTFYETTRLEVAKTAVNNLVTKLLANNNSHPDSVHVALVTFSNTATVKMGLTADEGSITSTVSGIKAGGGTNWEDALATARSIKTRDGASASVVFVSDGDPTYRASRGYEEEDFQSNYDSNTKKNYYGQGYDDTSGQCYKFAKTEAQKIVKENGWEFYSVAAFGNVGNMQQLVTDSGEQANGHYFEASDSSSLNTAFDSIVKSITTTVSYTNVSIHDALSQSVNYVLPDGAKEPTFTYRKNGELWTPTTLAKVENGSVVWNVGDLEPNVTYSVTFKVQLTQEAYDAAAPKGDEEAVTSVKTNSDDEAKDYVQYQIKTDVNGTPTTSNPENEKYKSPIVNVPTSTLCVSKTWDKKGWDNMSLPPELQVKVQQDEKDYKTVKLNAGNGWKAYVVVAAGPTGHKYSVVEKTPAGWDSSTPNVVNLQGLTSQNGDQAIKNTIKTNKLTITKSVTGNFGDTSKAFNFTLTDAFGNAITNVKAVDGTSDGVSLGNNGSFTLENGQKLVVELPYGASYKVVENVPKGTNDTVDYTTTIDAVGDATIDKDTPRTASSPEGGITKDTTITYTNKRDVTPDVGVDLGSGAPYAAVFGGAGLAGVIWMVLKRRNSLGI